MKTPFTVSQRHDKFAIDISYEDGPSMRIQARKGGYKLDTWWDNNSKQASTWVKYTGTEGDYAYHNTHKRDAEIDTRETAAVITDPKPRGKEVGHEPATIVVMFDPKKGFEVTVNWVNESGKKRQSYAVCPLYDPQVETEREKFYELLEQEERDIKPIPAFPQE